MPITVWNAGPDLVVQLRVRAILHRRAQSRDRDL